LQNRSVGSEGTYKPGTPKKRAATITGASD
jgi:hypothetical protein